MSQEQLEQEQSIITVSELNSRARRLLETHFSLLWIEGELSNLACPSSGHWYFTLKDDRAQVRCAMFRNRNQRLKFTPEDGMHVVVRAHVSLYEGRGDYQLIVEHLEEVGYGALQRAFDQLKKQLAKEGLFDQALKQSLPEWPTCLGVITSPTGAAIHDVLTVLARRFPALPVIVFPVAVQGENSASDIVRAIELANQDKRCDVLIVGRGGGSLEDLWSFNEEIVVRAIFASDIPIVSAVGHEVDVTIADFVADVRAPTPSAAAELISPDQYEYLQYFIHHEQHQIKIMKRMLIDKQQQLTWLGKRLQHPGRRLQHPGRRLQQQAQRLDDIEIRLTKVMLSHLRLLQTRLIAQTTVLWRLTPKSTISLLWQQLAQAQQRLNRAIHIQIQHKQQRHNQLMTQLVAISPQATLDRGYAIVTTVDTGALVRESLDIEPGTQIAAQLAKGTLHATVDKVSKK